MGAGYYPLGGVLARQGQGQAMRNYEPKLCKKQPTIIIKLPTHRHYQWDWSRGLRQRSEVNVCLAPNACRSASVAPSLHSPRTHR